MSSTDSYKENMKDYHIETDKDAYQHIVKSLTEQAARSTDENGECRYRGGNNSVFENCYNEAEKQCEKDHFYSDEEEKYAVISDIYRDLCLSVPYNLKCAIGHLIDSTHYTQEIEGESVGSVEIIEVIQKSNPNWKISRNSLMFLRLMQLVHDTYQVEDWPMKFAALQDRFDDNGSFVVAHDETLNELIDETLERKE